MKTSWETSKICRRTMLACSVLSLLLNIGLHASVLNVFDHASRPQWLSASQANAERLRHCGALAHTTEREACVTQVMAALEKERASVRLASSSGRKP